MELVRFKTLLQNYRHFIIEREDLNFCYEKKGKIRVFDRNNEDLFNETYQSIDELIEGFFKNKKMKSIIKRTKKVKHYNFSGALYIY